MKTTDPQITIPQDGQPRLRHFFPSLKWHRVPKWMRHRARAFNQSRTRTFIDHRGKTRFESIHPARYLTEEFEFMISSIKLRHWLFDHWGTITLPDGRKAVITCPYGDARREAELLAANLGLELLTAPGELSEYGHGTFLFIFAEPIQPIECQGKG